MDSSNEKLLKDIFAELQCPVCLGNFREPKQLMCGHTICRNCIQPPLYNMTERYISCPTKCLTLTHLEIGQTPASLPDNFSFKNMLHLLGTYKASREVSNSLVTDDMQPSTSKSSIAETKIICSRCVVGTSGDKCLPTITSLCKTCNEFFCSVHSASHDLEFSHAKNSGQSTSTHQQLSSIPHESCVPLSKFTKKELESFLYDYGINFIPLCSNHPRKKLKLWCSTCETFVCSDCTFMPIHSGHNIVLLSNHTAHIEDICNSLKDDVALLPKESEVKEKLASKAKSVTDKVNDNYNKAVKDINKYFDTQAKFLEKRRKVLLDLVSHHKTTQLGSIQRHTKQVEDDFKTIKDHQFVDNRYILMTSAPKWLKTVRESASRLKNWKIHTTDYGFIFFPGKPYGNDEIPVDVTCLNKYAGAIYTKDDVADFRLFWPTSSRVDEYRRKFTPRDVIPFNILPVNYRKRLLHVTAPFGSRLLSSGNKSGVDGSSFIAQQSSTSQTHLLDAPGSGGAAGAELNENFNSKMSKSCEGENVDLISSLENLVSSSSPNVDVRSNLLSSTLNDANMETPVSSTGATMSTSNLMVDAAAPVFTTTNLAQRLFSSHPRSKRGGKMMEPKFKLFFEVGYSDVTIHPGTKSVISNKPNKKNERLHVPKDSGYYVNVKPTHLRRAFATFEIPRKKMRKRPNDNVDEGERKLPLKRAVFALQNDSGDFMRSIDISDMNLRFRLRDYYDDTGRLPPGGSDSSSAFNSDDDQDDSSDDSDTDDDFDTEEEDLDSQITSTTQDQNTNNNSNNSSEWESYEDSEL